MTLRARINDREVKRAIKRAAKRYPAALAEGLNRTGFELREAEAEEVGRAFEFSGSSTRRFLANKASFTFDRATERRLGIVFYPKKAAAKVIEDHVGGSTITTREGGRLSYEGMLAVPVDLKRTARGRVRRGRKPAEVIARGKSFVSKSGRAIVERVNRKHYRVLYALVPQARLRPRVDFFGVAERTVRKVFVGRVRRALQRRGVR